ncbi:regulator of Vps4 activity in the MVB pathway-domain-containing protein [Hysterangium stoloniferum]|nr:regulator of Vps4 activity in the MVB pathway-domain-containing protein [Hysterangium stoloniferum]
MATWDSTRLQSQLRLTSYKLAQLQERHDQASNITKRDIATLIEQNEIKTARIKVEKLIQDDRLSTLIEMLESFCNLLLERFGELRNDLESNRTLTDAVYGLITIGPRSELKDVVVLREMLIQMCGPEATRTILNHDCHIPPQVVDALDRRPPSIEHIDVFMTSIAKEFNLSWTPPLLSHQKARALAEILDQNALSRTIDLQELREIAVRGIPSQPAWLRPRLWKILLGTLSYQKDFWEVEAHMKRQSYYDLARPLLGRLRSTSPPTTPLSSMDALLLAMAKSLSTLPSELDVDIEASPLCPFDDNAPEGLKIHDADAVDDRLRLIQANMHGLPSPVGPPEIHVEDIQTPHILISLPNDSSPVLETSTSNSPLILIRGHASSLLRLMYIHVSLHSAASATYLTSVLVPLYMAMVQEIDPAELAHVEADTFWLLNELWGEVSDLTDTERSQHWVSKFGQRLAWADPNLHGDLVRKGLDPASPNYSYRWLAPLLTRTLAPPALLPIWDALFTQPPRTNTVNAKLEFLLDICTAMLINARPKLFRMGKPPASLPGLWSDVDATVQSRSTTPIEFEEGFIQGMSFLQKYPVEELGGSERIIEIAREIQSRRSTEASSITRGGLGDRIRGTVWSGLLNRGGLVQSQVPESPGHSDGTPSPEWPDSGEEDEGDHTERPNALTLSKLGTTVWRGITNQSSMDVPPSPLPPSTPIKEEYPVATSATSTLNHPLAAEAARLGGKLGNTIWRGLVNQSAMDDPPSPSGSPPPTYPETPISPTSSTSSGIWGYAGKFKDSDAVASLSKTGTNITAKASAFWRRSNPSNPTTLSDTLSHNRASSVAASSTSLPDLLQKRGSVSSSNHDEGYSPPPRPHFRESRYFSPDEQHPPGSPSISFANLSSPPALLVKGRAALASLAGSTPTPPPPPPQRSGPRPLLLNSSSLITSSNSRRSSRSPAPRPRDSLSSTSSVSTPLSQRKNTAYSDRDSDVGSGKLVSLRRNFPPRRTDTKAHSDTGDMPQFESFAEKGGSILASPNLNGRESAQKGWTQVNPPDLPSTLLSSPPPVTSITMKSEAQVQQQPVIATDVVQRDASLSEGTMRRKKSWNSATSPVAPRAEASDSSTSQDPIPWTRGKRHHGARPAHLRLKKSNSEFEQSVSRETTEFQHTANGDPESLLPEVLGEVLAVTPKAADFSSPDVPRTRKNSRSPGRVYDGESPVRGSGGEEGDDEGYDDFLSAYESEDGVHPTSSIGTVVSL